MKRYKLFKQYLILDTATGQYLMIDKKRKLILSKKYAKEYIKLMKENQMNLKNKTDKQLWDILDKIDNEIVGL